VIIGSDGFNQPGPIVEGAGEAAEGFVTTISVLPISELPSRGQEFAAEFEERFGARPCCYTVHTAQATHMMLDAIEASNGTRAQVLENLFSARVEDGYVGDFTIDRTGDATVSTIVVYEINEGRLSFKTALAPPSKLFAPE
jgi:ABC-type branched-subunit amino acid transport system substrate-binding protein